MTAILFAGALLHSRVPNPSGYTQFSIDFPATRLADVKEYRGVLNARTGGRGRNTSARG